MLLEFGLFVHYIHLFLLNHGYLLDICLAASTGNVIVVQLACHYKRSLQMICEWSTENIVFAIQVFVQQFFWSMACTSVSSNQLQITDMPKTLPSVGCKRWHRFLCELSAGVVLHACLQLHIQGGNLGQNTTYRFNWSHLK